MRVTIAALLAALTVALGFIAYDLHRVANAVVVTTGVGTARTARTFQQDVDDMNRRQDYFAALFKASLDHASAQANKDEPGQRSRGKDGR